MTSLLHAIALALYAGSALLLVASVSVARRSLGLAGALLGATGVLVHGAALAAYTIGYGELPLVGLGPSLSTLSFLIGGFVLLSVGFREMRPLGLILVPIMGVLLGAALGLRIAPTDQTVAWEGLWFGLHVLLAFTAYAGLAVAFAAGLMYLLQFRELKTRRLGRIFRFLPSLESLDRLGRRALVVGFPALSVALLLGWAHTVRFHSTFILNETHVIWGVLTWLVFVVALGARTGRACERRGAIASVIGFAVVVLAYLALRIALAEGRVFL